MDRRAERAAGGRSVGGVAVAFAVAVAALPLLAAVSAVLGGPWYPTADDALISLRVGDVLTHATPLLGVYSRFGWNHPGPALFATLWPFRAVLGPAGLVVGAGVVGSAALGLTFACFRRRGGAPLVLLGGVVLLVLVVALGNDVIDPWNPYVSVLPFLSLVAVTWSVLDGDRRLLPVAVGLGSWLVQVHIGYAVVAGSLVVVAAVAVAVRWRTSPARAEVAVAGAVLLAFWLPPLWEQVTGHPGNLSRILDAPARDLVGFGSAIGVVARDVVVPRGWLLGQVPGGSLLGAVVPTPGWTLAVPALLAVGAAVLAGTRGRDRTLVRSALRFQACTGLLVAASVVSVARIEGPVLSYLVRWQWVVAACVWLGIAWSVLVGANVVGARAGRVVGPSVPRWVSGGLVVVLGAAVLGAGVHAVAATPPDAPLSATVAVLVGPVSAAVASDDVVKIRSEGEFRDEFRNGLGAALERRGVAVRYPVGSARRVGTDRVRRGPVDAVLTVAVGDARAARLAAGESPVVAVDPLPAAARARLERLERRSAAVTAARVAGRTVRDLTPAQRSALDRLRAAGPPVAVFRSAG